MGTQCIMMVAWAIGRWSLYFVGGSPGGAVTARLVETAAGSSVVVSSSVIPDMWERARFLVKTFI